MTYDQQMLNANYQERIDAGVLYLDDLLGVYWPLLIDVERLCLLSPCNCVLGQIAASYNPLTDFDSWINGEIEGFQTAMRREETRERGFDLWRGAVEITLRKAWSDKISTLQKERTNYV